MDRCYLAGSPHSSVIATSAKHNIAVITGKWAWVIIGRIMEPCYISHASIDMLDATRGSTWAITSLVVFT